MSAARDGASTPSRGKARAGSAPRTRRVRLKPQDSFELIRLLARSQSDPRKAVGELVQNSLDAGARHIELRWFNEQGRRALRVLDDGSGVFPDVDRETALRRIAQTIGHSHKRDLTPSQRRELMVLGKYGIGLLGFWSIGEEMVLRSRVGGGDALCLRMREDRRQGEIYRPRKRRLDEPETFTEITIRRLHPGATRQLRPVRLRPYLARELRGQLLGRQVEVVIHDRVVRGRARKRYPVEAQPFLGAPLTRHTALDVKGHEPARLELYHVPEDEDRRGTVALACGGTVVLDDLAAIEGGDAAREPWSLGRFEGVVDFPDLEVAPGTRRGFVPNEAYAAFLRALPALERELTAFLEKERRLREERRQKDIAREIRRAFRAVARKLPDYDMFEIKAGRAREGGDDAEAEGAPLEESAANGAVVESDEPTPEPADALLFESGPLAQLRIQPARKRLAPGATAEFRALALDADGRPARGRCGFEWTLEGPGELTPDRDRALYLAPGFEAQATLRAVARSGGAACETNAGIRVAEPEAGPNTLGGIPEPTPVHAPSESWRSRMAGGRWEFNTGHRDYQEAAQVEARRLRYIFALFAKELVLRNFGKPADAELLERLVEVLTYLDARPTRARSA